jgi:hypothetical protein
MNVKTFEIGITMAIPVFSEVLCLDAKSASLEGFHSF